MLRFRVMLKSVMLRVQLEGSELKLHYHCLIYEGVATELKYMRVNGENSKADD